MRTYRLVALGAALLLVLAPVGARAAGTITGLSFTPPTATKDQPVTITVLGEGGCGKIKVIFDDPNSAEPSVELSNISFKNNVNDTTTHSYANAGTYNVTATPVPNEGCDGQDSKTLTVGNGGGNGGSPAGGTPGYGTVQDSLCGILDNCPFEVKSKPVMKLLPPHLENLFWWSVIEPGGDVIVFGQRFGDTQGELHMVLKTDHKDVKLKVNVWANGHIGGTIPSTTIGVVDQKAEFYVKRSDGSEGNRHGDASFTAKRELKILPRSDVSVVQCGFYGDCDGCLTTYDPDNDDDCAVYPASVPKAGTLSGWHLRDYQMSSSKAEGTDSYKSKTPLKNGWQLENALLGETYIDSGKVFASVSFTASQIKVDWVVHPTNWLLYDVYVIIEGPVGTSYK